jgi:hypothetical protein
VPRLFRRCPGCRRRFSRRSRPVCYRCRKRGVKARPAIPPPRPDVYSPTPNRGSRGAVPDFYGQLPTPYHPTGAMPGSSDRIEVMRGRLERGEGLWHPRDPGRLNLERFAGVVA